MTWPLEGSREIDEGIIISEPMDWCKSPTAIVPYRLYAYQREATNLADSVRQTDDRTHVKGSIILASYGDEPGVGGGVISGTHNAECTPKTWSDSVFAEGRNVVRHEDEWWMIIRILGNIELYQRSQFVFNRAATKYHPAYGDHAFIVRSNRKFKYKQRFRKVFRRVAP